MSPVPRRRIVLAALAAVALGASLWLPPLRRESVDMDEAFSRNVLASPPRLMIWKVRADRTHPPLYYLLVKPYAAVAGTSPTALRLPSIAAALATTALATAATAVITGSAAAGLLAGVLIAASDTHAFYAMQLRSYALYELLVLAMLVCVAWVLRAPDRRARWVVLAVAIGAATQTHYLAWFWVASAGVVLLLSRELRRWVPWLIAASVPALLALAAWYALIREFLLAGSLGNISWIGPPHRWILIRAAWRIVGFPPRWWSWEHVRPGAVCASISLALGAWLVVEALRRRESPTGESRWRRTATLLLLAGCLVPPILLLAPSLPPLRRHIFVDRHLLPTAAMWAMLVATGVAALSRRAPRGAVAVGTALVLLSLAPTLHASRRQRRLPHRDASAYILGRSAPGDTVLVAEWFNIGWPQRAYLEGRRVVRALPRNRDRLPSRFWLVTNTVSGDGARAIARVASDEVVRREGVRFHAWPGAGEALRVEFYERRGAAP